MPPGMLQSPEESTSSSRAVPGTLARAKLHPLAVELKCGHNGRFSGSNSNRVSSKKVSLITAAPGGLSKSHDLSPPHISRLKFRPNRFTLTPPTTSATSSMSYFFLTSHLTTPLATAAGFSPPTTPQAYGSQRRKRQGQLVRGHRPSRLREGRRAGPDGFRHKTPIFSGLPFAPLPRLGSALPNRPRLTLGPASEPPPRGGQSPRGAGGLPSGAKGGPALYPRARPSRRTEHARSPPPLPAPPCAPGEVIKVSGRAPTGAGAARGRGFRDWWVVERGGCVVWPPHRRQPIGALRRGKPIAARARFSASGCGLKPSQGCVTGAARPPIGSPASALFGLARQYPEERAPSYWLADGAARAAAAFSYWVAVSLRGDSAAPAVTS